jgi:hypothetical protein
MTDTTDKKTPSETTVPSALADLEWVWVLTSPLTKVRDSIFVLEMEERDSGTRRRVVPIFESRPDAEALKGRLCQGSKRPYTEEAMLLNDVGRFAAKNNLEIMLLDATGAIAAHLKAKMEKITVH